jgi:hypothetical protein
MISFVTILPLREFRYQQYSRISRRQLALVGPALQQSPRSPGPPNACTATGLRREANKRVLRTTTAHWSSRSLRGEMREGTSAVAIIFYSVFDGHASGPSHEEKEVARSSSTLLASRQCDAWECGGRCPPVRLSKQKNLQLYAVDHSARASMKSAASCVN